MMKGPVLIIDSASAYRRKAAERLKAAGIDVVEADGAGAAAAMGLGPFALVVVDGGMDRREGATIIEESRRLDAAAKLVLICGGDVYPDDSAGFCREHGVTEVIRGPIHPDALVRTVIRLVGRDSLPPAEATSRLREIRDSYRLKLPGEFDRLASLADQARSKPGDLGLLREIHRLAHSIHGTAGTMGFAEISLAAGDIEREIARGLADGHPFAVSWESVLDAIERARRAPERPSRQPGEAPRMTGVASLLVVDDDPEMIGAIELLARKNLVQAVSALGREEALALARDRRLDGALIDIYLANGENPFEIAESLRGIEGHEALPIAFMSVDGSVPNRVGAVAAGATCFLEKPLGAEDLAEAVRGFVALREPLVPRVLVVDDDEFFRAHTAALLSGEGMTVSTLGDPGRIFETLDSFRPDILLLDVMMPEVDGFDVCRMLRASSAWRDLPILFLTAEQSSETRIECFLAGGDDYIGKPVMREELLARIGVRVERAKLFKERTDRDMLTGLPNRRAFMDLFGLRLADAARDGRPLSLCLLDLDRFKEINDTKGHLAGDRVLAGLGRLLASRFRSTDIRARWGGEEFTLAFLGEERQTARLILERVQEEFGRMTFEDDQARAFSCTFSAGVATSPEDGESFEDLFKAADRRLYRAKDEGRARVV